MAIEVLSRAMAPPHFPITPRELRGRWEFEAIDAGRYEYEGFDVLARDIPHKGGRTFGYRVTADDATTVAYLSDHAPHVLGDGPSGLGALHPSALELADGADLLIHDAQYTIEELATRRPYGHCAADYAAELGAAAGARRVLLFHHDPNRSDAEVRRLAAGVRHRHPGVCVQAATEGMEIVL